jgi:F-type H+-transporting ATPase subunit b
MRRAAFALALGMAFAPSILPQEAAARPEAEQHDPWIFWKWINFAILAGGLGYLISKHAPAFFDNRSKEILQGIADGAKALQEARSRAASIEQRLAGIQTEIDKLRGAGRAEMTEEGERMQRETERHLQKLQEQAAQEITLMTRASKDELRKYSAELALQLAEQRIRSRITKEDQNGLMDAFLDDLRRESTLSVRAK